MRRLVELHVVEDEELERRAEVGRVRDAGALHVVDGLAGDVPRVARVVLLGQRVLDVADHRQRDVLAERVDEQRVRLRHEQHVRLVDRLPAADAGAVEADAVLEDASSSSDFGRDGEVLPEAGEVHEPQIDGLDLAFAEEGQDFAGRAGGFASGHGSPSLAS